MKVRTGAAVMAIATGLMITACTGPPAHVRASTGEVDLTVNTYCPHMAQRMGPEFPVALTIRGDGVLRHFDAHQGTSMVLRLPEGHYLLSAVPPTKDQPPPARVTAAVTAGSKVDVVVGGNCPRA